MTFHSFYRNLLLSQVLKTLDFLERLQELKRIITLLKVHRLMVVMKKKELKDHLNLNPRALELTSIPIGSLIISLISGLSFQIYYHQRLKQQDKSKCYCQVTSIDKSSQIHTFLEQKRSISGHRLLEFRILQHLFLPVFISWLRIMIEKLKSLFLKKEIYNFQQHSRWQIQKIGFIILLTFFSMEDWDIWTQKFQTVRTLIQRF